MNIQMITVVSSLVNVPKKAFLLCKCWVVVKEAGCMGIVMFLLLRQPLWAQEECLSAYGLL